MSTRARHLAQLALATGMSLATATVAVAILQDVASVGNASAAYLVAVVLVALLVGTDGAIVTAFGAAALYNFLFTEPRYTFAIHDPGVLLSVVLLLFVGIVVGQLAALQRQRAETATAREREARALFTVSRLLATRASMGEALGAILDVLVSEARLDRTWVGIGVDPASETVAADTGDGRTPAPPGRLRVLQRAPGAEPARWLLVQRPGVAARAPAAVDTYRVRIEASGEPLGSLWATRARATGEPDPVQTRLLAGAADQVGQAITHDRVADQSRAAEVARQSDALKSALLQSVSHDLRTPLATIRAAAGSLRPGEPFSDEDRRAGADAIEREVAYLDRLVTNLLDLSRIEAGALRPSRELFDLDDLLARALESARSRLDGRRLEADLRSAPVEVDPVFVDEAVTNVLDNALKYTPSGSLIRVSARDVAPDRVCLTIEDDGPGVPDELLARLFEKFYRVPRGTRPSREGTGIGLAVARGLVEATGGSVAARRSELGGLAVDLEFPARAVPLTPGAVPLTPGAAA
ncbi:MAG TPA: ATP-binding protein [Candidatus Limnocylindrales bacterium]|nr:ATP-binding protein [Candidatus Limnocylindrales bacterium]